MIFRTILILLIVIIVGSCFQKSTKGERQIEEGPIQKYDLKRGLRIDNGPTRGQFLTDSIGMKHGLVYIKTTITNDSTTPIDIQIDFAQEYDYPTVYGEEQFKLILLPKVFTLDRVEIADSVLNEVLHDKNKQSFRETLKPNEECVLSIGILRPSRLELCSATPYALLELSNDRSYFDCDWSKDKSRELKEKIVLGVKVGFCTVGGDYESCTIIPCGQISYLEH